jgi:hypothetical protein
MWGVAHLRCGAKSEISHKRADVSAQECSGTMTKLGLVPDIHHRRSHVWPTYKT